MEDTAKMIRFLCDLCGKDISEKVHDSVKQFCGRDHFEQSIIPEVTQDDSTQLAGMRYEVEHERNPVYLDVQLLDELSKLIHASAWGMPAATMQCSNCAPGHAEKKKGKAITIFTRIAETQCAI